jgi:hypothetical protein
MVMVGVVERLWRGQCEWIKDNGRFEYRIDDGNGGNGVNDSEGEDDNDAHVLNEKRKTIALTDHYANSYPSPRNPYSPQLAT